MNDYSILPDIYFGEDIPLSLLVFSAERLLIAMPPAECRISFFWPERTSIMSGEIRDGDWADHTVSPRQVLGVSDEAYTALRNDDNITLIEWSPHEIENRTHTWNAYSRKKPKDILHTTPLTHAFLAEKIPQSEIKREVALFSWAKLLTANTFSYEKCIHNIPSLFQWGDAERKYEAVRHCLANEAFKMAIHGLRGLSIKDALELRRVCSPYLRPFWRTMARLQAECFLDLVADTTFDEVQLRGRRIVHDQLGTSLDAWAAELDHDMAKVLGDAKGVKTSVISGRISLAETAAQATAKAEQEAINKALLETGGNREKAADLLGIGRKTLYRKLRQYGTE